MKSMLIRPGMAPQLAGYTEYFWTLALPGGTYSFSSDGSSIGEDLANLGIIYNSPATEPFPALMPRGSFVSVGTENGPRVTTWEEDRTLSNAGKSIIIALQMYGVDINGNDLYLGGGCQIAAPLAGEVISVVNKPVSFVNGGGGTPAPTYGIRFETAFVYVNDKVDASVIIPSSILMVGRPSV